MIHAQARRTEGRSLAVEQNATAVSPVLYVGQPLRNRIEFTQADGDSSPALHILRRVKASRDRVIRHESGQEAEAS